MAVSKMSQPAVLLRLEGLALLALSALLYARIDGSWLLFAALLLAPDIAMLGYLVSPSFGALCYNLAHAKLLPSALAAAGLLAGQPLLLALALIWFAHIGMDRAVGYGLKYADAFKHTHLGQV